MEKFQLSEFAREGESILNAVRREFKNLKMDESKLPKALSDNDATVKLVFVGQYSAGKSSIVKMLSGADVEIGAKITTQSAKSFFWNGLEIIDTPGIHTEYRLDHDKITYEQINNAAMLIFVITNEGFDRVIGEHFRNLAIKQKRAANMVLVVNKIDRTALGNIGEQQEIITNDLIKVIEPYTPNNLYLSFLSTEDYFSALDESDDEIKYELIDRSGYNVFVSNLNKFVTEHAIMAKISAPLYKIADQIRSAIASTTLNKDAAGLEETIRHRKNLLTDGKNNCLRNRQSVQKRNRTTWTRSG